MFIPRAIFKAKPLKCLWKNYTHYANFGKSLSAHFQETEKPGFKTDRNRVSGPQGFLDRARMERYVFAEILLVVVSYACASK